MESRGPDQSSLLSPPFFHSKKGKLDLNNQRINDEYIQEILVPFLNDHPEIKKLNLYNNFVGDEGAKALACNTTLTKLKLRFNIIQDIGAIALAANTTLRLLNLKVNSIGKKGRKALAETNPTKRVNAAREIYKKDIVDITIIKEILKLNPLFSLLLVILFLVIKHDQNMKKNAVSSAQIFSSLCPAYSLIQVPSLTRLSIFAVNQALEKRLTKGRYTQEMVKEILAIIPSHLKMTKPMIKI